MDRDGAWNQFLIDTLILLSAALYVASSGLISDNGHSSSGPQMNHTHPAV